MVFERKKRGLFLESKVDVLLSCGHIQIVSLSKEIEFGEFYYCETCKKIEKIQNVGESWNEENEVENVS